ncbi:hypothetical protein [Mesorhizobium shangrilense]|uniref:Apea-like HEPN domain-containing protein n=1 Tax=Mesorhizobium shangrilense TaxID=460060 RepID=A0ABV2D993_9HYPH
MKFVGLFALYPALKFQSDFHIATYTKSLEYFRKPREIRLRGIDIHSGERIIVRVKKASKSIKKKYFNELIFYKEGNWLLEFEFESEFPGREKFKITRSDGHDESYTDKELVEFWASVIPSFLDLDIQTYFFALNFSFPGALHPVKSVWLVDEKLHHHSSSFHSMLEESIDYLVKNGFIPDLNLEPESMISWVFAQNGMLSGYSDTPASKALNYCTRLFVRSIRNDEISDLVWALAGIEALLVDGGRSSIGQLKNKLEALFRAHSNVKWLLESIDRMYAFRSKMVHGNRQIRSVFRDDEEDSSARSDEEYDAKRLAVGLLIILIQRLVRSGQTKFDFELSCLNA